MARARIGGGRKAWSPEQIARRLPIDFPDDKTMRISHEAIYQALFVQAAARCAES
ncbi:IS30 family transposase [Bradyrhizobium sp. i1.15.2]